MYKAAILLTAFVSLLHFPTHTVKANEDAEAYIRFAHFSPTTSAIDIWVDNRRSEIKGITYNTVTNWYTLPAGVYTIAFSDESDAPILEISVSDVTPSSWTTLALIGTVEHGTVRAQVISEDYSEIAPGEARLSVFHAIEGTPPIDLIANDAALLQYINYPNGHDGFVAVDVIANTYQMTVVPNDSTSIVLEIGSLTLTPGHNVLLAMIGTADIPAYTTYSIDLDETKQASHPPLLQPETYVGESGAHLRIAHLASGVAPIDVYINGQASVIETLPFATISDYLELPAGAQYISIMLGDNLLLPAFSVNLTESRWSTLALVGSPDNNSLGTQLFEENHEAMPANVTRIGVFQAVPGITPVNVQTADGETLIRLLGYPGSQGDNDGYEAIEVTAGTYDLDIVSASDPTEIIVDLPEINFQNQHSYLITTINAEPPFSVEDTAIQVNE